MFDRIASALIAPRRALRLVVDAAETVDTAAMKAEVASLFQSDLDDFTRMAMDRRARKAARGMVLAA